MSTLKFSDRVQVREAKGEPAWRSACCDESVGT